MTIPHGPDAPEGTVAVWKIVAGAFLHFGVVAYLLVVPALCFLRAPRGATTEQVFELLLSFSARFLLIVLLAGAGATILAALFDRVSRPRRTSASRRAAAAAALSDQALRDGQRAAQDLTDPTARGLTAQINAAAWDHEDPRFQRLARDYAELLVTSASALRQASPARRRDIEAMTSVSLSHLKDEIDRLTEARAAKAEQDARVVAGYVESRYGHSDFAIRDD